MPSSGARGSAVATLTPIPAASPTPAPTAIAVPVLNGGRP